MHFRAQRKLQGEVSLTETLESAGDGGSLSLMDTIAVDDTMLEDLDTRDACRKVRACVETCLTERERTVIVRRYGLDDRPPQTQREVAARCGISRSYVSRIEKRALEKLEAAMDGWTESGYDDSAWETPVVITPRQQDFTFVTRYDAPGRVVGELTAKECLGEAKEGSGSYIYDMGENVMGVDADGTVLVGDE